MLDWIKRNPVRVRSVVTALVIFTGWFVPAIIGVEEVIVAGVTAVLAVFLGWDASKRVVLPEDKDEGSDEPDEVDEALTYFRELGTDEGKHRRK